MHARLPVIPLAAITLLLTVLCRPHSAPAQPPSHTDILVYSGTPCGIAAAITAAREGAKVTLIEPTRHVGGLSTSGINTAESEHMLKWTIGGFALEFYERLGRHYGLNEPAYYFESSVAQAVYDAMLKEAGVTLLYETQVDKVTKEGALIREITLSNGSTAAAKVFIDASYDGDLMARAGVSYTIGRESKSEYGEEAAGIRFDKTARKAPTVDAAGNLLPGISGWARDYREGDAHPGVMNYNFRFTVARDPALRVPIPAPKAYQPHRYAILQSWLQERAAAGKATPVGDIIGLYKRRNGKFEMNNRQNAIFSLGHFGGQFEWPDASYEKRRQIYDDHMEYTLGLLHFLATDTSVPEATRKEMQSIGLHKDEFTDNGHLPYQLYVRESRRMKGVSVVTQQDVQENRRKADAIGISSHFIDSHHVQRLAVSPTEFVNEGRIWRMGYAYQIPYSSLLPQPAEARNLLVPCAASFSHVAYCTLRLESVWMITGHAAGLAATLAQRHNTDVQAVPVTELQDKLRAQKQVVDFIPGEPEKCTDLNGPPEF